MRQARSSIAIPLSILLPRNSSYTFIHRTIPLVQCIRQFSSTPTPRVSTIKKSRFRQTRLDSEATKLSDIPNDLGFLQVAIPPTKKGSPGQYPLVWKEPRNWFSLQQMRYALHDLRRTQMKQFELNHPQYEINTQDLEKLGFILYKQMNTSFAAGNDPKEIATLRKICGKTFADTLISSAEAREEGTKVTWKWEKTLSKPKLVSFLSVPIIKGHPEAELIQVIIRIHGRESLSDGVSEPTTQDSYGYIVLHNKMWIRPANWHIIGRVGETSMEKVIALAKRTKAMMQEQKSKRRSLRPDGIFKRAYKGILAAVSPGSVIGSSGARIEPPPSPQSNTRKK